MLGRTHMAVGAAASVVASPLILHVPWETLRQLAYSHWSEIPNGLIGQALLVASAILGSLVPDLDQRDSMAAQRVERVGQIVACLLMAAVIFVLGWQANWNLWAVVAVITFTLGSNSNTARKIGLAVIGVGLLYLALRWHIPMTGAFLLAVWIVGAMFTAHRTFTHSLLGTAIFIAGAFAVLGAFGRVYGIPMFIAAWGLTLGYILHLVGDGVAGGVPLLWPRGGRQGIRLVKTGSYMDHALGIAATVVFLGTAIF